MRKNILTFFIKKICSMLSIAALFFALSPCGGYIYDPPIPEALKKQLPK